MVRFLLVLLFIFNISLAHAQELSTARDFLDLSTDLYNNDRTDSALKVIDLGLKRFPGNEDLGAQFYWLLDRYRSDSYDDSSSLAKVNGFLIKTHSFATLHKADTTVLEWERLVTGDMIKRALDSAEKKMALGALKEYADLNRNGNKTNSVMNACAVVLDLAALHGQDSGRLLDLFLKYYRSVFQIKKEDAEIFLEVLEWYDRNVSAERTFLLMSELQTLEGAQKLTPEMEKHVQSELLKSFSVIDSSVASIVNLNRLCKKYPANQFLRKAQPEITAKLLKVLIRSGQLQTAAWIFRICGYDALEDKNYLDLRKQWYLEEYKSGFARTDVSTDELKWSGSFISCSPGTVSETANEKVLARVNFFRAVGWLRDSIVLDEGLNAKSMAAALMLGANGVYDYDPFQKYKCYSKDGYDGTRYSCLGLVEHSSLGVLNIMRDNSSSAGNRINLLAPQMKKIGHGSTDRSFVLYVLDGDYYPRKTEESFYAWPPPGVISMDLLFSQWSLLIDRPVSYEHANINVTVEGKDMPVEIVSLNNGFNSLVWRLPYFFTSGEETTIDIKISGIRIIGQESPVTIKYFVKVLK
jgi:hypothetical protein